MAYPTFDPDNIGSGLTLSGGNLTVTATTTTSARAAMTTAQGQSTGKWYYEVTASNLTGGRANVGLVTAAHPTNVQIGVGVDSYDRYYGDATGLLYNSVTVKTLENAVAGDVISVLYDADAGTLTFWKNGVADSNGSYTGVVADSYFPAVTPANSGSAYTINFGATAFAYTPPAGYSAWVAAGLPEAAASFPALTAAAYSPYGNTTFAAMTALAGAPAVGVAAFLPMFATTPNGVGNNLAMTAAGYVIGAAPAFAAMTATSEGDQLDYAIAAFAAMAAAAEGVGGTALQFAGIAPTPILAAVGVSGATLTAALRAPAPVLVAINYSPAFITVAGSVPPPRLSAALLTGNVITVSLTVPALTLATVGYPAYTITATLVAPAPRLDAALVAAITAAFRTWALNLRKGAISEYGPEFAFNSFAMFNGQVLACGDSGVVVLDTQGLDNTTAITGRIRTGQESFESSVHKRVPRIYTSGIYAGDMLFRTIVEGGTRTYNLPFNAITRLQQRRVPVGKGPKSRFWAFELENVGGADFSVNDVLVLPTKLRRRVQ